MLCVSRSVARALAQEGVPPRKIEVAENGVSAPGRCHAGGGPQAARVERLRVVVGSRAALRPEKAHELLLEAVARLGAEDRPVRLCRGLRAARR